MNSQFTCSACGVEVHPNAAACSHCGASRKRSEAGGDWEAGGLDLPDEEFDYEEFVASEFKGGGMKPKGLSTFWWVTGIILLIAFSLIALRLW